MPATSGDEPAWSGLGERDDGCWTGPDLGGGRGGGVLLVLSVRLSVDPADEILYH